MDSADNADGDSIEDRSGVPSCKWCEEVKLLEGCDPLPSSCRDNMPRQPSLKCRCKVNRVNKLNRSFNHRPSTLMRFLRMGGTGKVKEISTSSPFQCSSRRESNKYFDHNGGNYRFNYQRLFAPCKCSHLDSDQLRLREQFAKALDEDVGYLNAILEGDKSDSLDSLVDRSAKRIFQAGTELFQQEYKKLEAEKAKEGPHQRLDFGQDYYDANNIGLMKEMLRLGLEKVAQDRRYILPTLPNVHSVPLLIKWICARYGKLFSEKERKRQFVKASVLMNHLMFLLRKEVVLRHCLRPIPHSGDILNIEEQINMNRLLIHYWDHFMKYFVLSMMELGRIFHSTMESGQGTKSTSTYYTYMPAHIRDIEFSRRTPFMDRRGSK